MLRPLLLDPCLNLVLVLYRSCTHICKHLINVNVIGQVQLLLAAVSTISAMVRMLAAHRRPSR